MQRLILLALLALTLVAHQPRVFAEVTPTATPAADQQADRCERNDSAARACALALDAVHGPFTFLPEGDQDYYSLNLGAEATGLETQITVRGTGGLDLRATITRAGEDAPLATFTQPVTTTTLRADVTGWVVVRVENRAAALANGQSYRMEVRRVLPPPGPVVPDALAAAKEPAPDALENNWSVETAAPIAVGAIYDLNFTCPVTGSCAGGDHDYLRVPVKAGITYVVGAFDLGPGVDTTIDLFWRDAGTPTATNDDVAPGKSFVSMLRWTAPANGDAIVRVGPRTGRERLVVFEAKAATYRFAIALAESDLGTQIIERIHGQAGLAAPQPATTTGGQGSSPAPTSTSATQPPTSGENAPADPAPTQASIRTEFVTTGTALVTTNTVLRLEAGATGTEMEPLRADSRVTLLGRASGLWVMVKPVGGILAGWVDYRTLRALGEDGAAEDTNTTTSPGMGSDAESPSASAPQANATPVPSSATLRATPLEDAPLPAAAPQQPAVALSVAVTVQEAMGERRQPAIGERVQLVDAFGRVLAEANTDGAGSVTLQRAIAPRTAVLLRLPALGLETPVDIAEPALTITIPARGGV
ncbi:MAG: hypothetical protein RLZZ387_2526 [Chloroflexota bacterium]|jgi:hypothetical protein